MNKNTVLKLARQEKQDEFYTQLSDIEMELQHYSADVFSGKVVLCNCDNPDHSNFWRYFHKRFKAMGLKKLIAIHYSISEPAYKKEYTGGADEEITAGVMTPLCGDGDFRSDECIDILREADIVVTNPPFSLMIPYLMQIMEYHKQFIIIGNMNIVLCKSLTPYFVNNQVWTGVTNFNKGMYFIVPGDFKYRSTYDNRREIGEEKASRVSGCCWFTNIAVSRPHRWIDTNARYDPDKYPMLENYDAINVNSLAEIPMDYTGVMAVPCTFIDKYNPEQFEFLGLDSEFTYDGAKGLLNGKRLYARLFIKARHPLETAKG